MSFRTLCLLAAAGSAALLLGALAFQYLGNLPPCKLCVWQRWPHLAAALIGALILVLPLRPLALAGAAAALTSSGIGLYHFGVENRWWEGPNTCTSGSVTGLDPKDLLNQILEAPVIRCDEVMWDFLGLSLAGWNMVVAAGLALIWLIAWRAWP